MGHPAFCDLAVSLREFLINVWRPGVGNMGTEKYGDRDAHRFLRIRTWGTSPACPIFALNWEQLRLISPDTDLHTILKTLGEDASMKRSMALLGPVLLGLMLLISSGIGLPASFAQGLGATQIGPGLQNFADCQNQVKGHSEHLMADRLQAKLDKSSSLTPEDRDIWVAEIRALRQVKPSQPYKAPDPKNPQRYFLGLTERRTNRHQFHAQPLRPGKQSRLREEIRWHDALLPRLRPVRSGALRKRIKGQHPDGHRHRDHSRGPASQPASQDTGADARREESGAAGQATGGGPAAQQLHRLGQGAALEHHGGQDAAKVRRQQGTVGQRARQFRGRHKSHARRRRPETGLRPAGGPKKSQSGHDAPDRTGTTRGHD